MGSLGLVCLLHFYSLAVFGEMNQYPYLFPFCIIAGMVAFVCCLLLFFINFNVLTTMQSGILKTILFEILVVIVTFIPFLFAWSYAIKYIGTLF
jgi:hypothetical protein